jgi:hypothetical protein
LVIFYWFSTPYLRSSEIDWIKHSSHEQKSALSNLELELFEEYDVSILLELFEVCILNLILDIAKRLAIILSDFPWVDIEGSLLVNLGTIESKVVETSIDFGIQGFWPEVKIDIDFVQLKIGDQSSINVVHQEFDVGIELDFVLGEGELKILWELYSKVDWGISRLGLAYSLVKLADKFVPIVELLAEEAVLHELGDSKAVVGDHSGEERLEYGVWNV